MPRSKTNKKNIHKSKRIFFNSRKVVIALLICVLVVVPVVIKEYFDARNKNVQQELSILPANVHPPDSARRSLDLLVAKKADYNSSPFAVTKMYQPSNQVVKKLINFNVNGLKEYALMTVPVSVQPITGYPVLILCHGYVNPSDYQTKGNAYFGDMQFYSQHGFVVIRPDFRGNGLSEGSPEGTYYSMAYNIDLMSLISSIKKVPYLDKKNISLWGHSMGAYISLRASVISPDVKNAFLISGPVGTPKDMFTLYIAPSDRLNPIARQIRQSTLDQYGTPLSNPVFWENTSPLKFVGTTNTKFQIYVGSNDRVVPPAFSKDLDEALTKENVPHKYIVFPGGDHGLLSEREVIWKETLAALAAD